MQRYAVVQKYVGETPLEALERLRATLQLSEDTPLAYAGRLDPMASGTLLILIGDECKRQAEYHDLDKEYLFSVLFGISSDTGDVLGILKSCTKRTVAMSEIKELARILIGKIELPYPHFSSKTVRGKPLHIWTLEGRLSEIEIPIKRSVLHQLKCTGIETIQGRSVSERALIKIHTVTEVTEESKQLGKNFRRDAVRSSWDAFAAQHGEEIFQIAHFRCVASSGTYMRSLSEEIAKLLGTCGLAYAIERTSIGKYLPLTRRYGLWTKVFK